MPPKLNVPPESNVSKTAAKTKKRSSKIKRNTKSANKTKNSAENNNKLENNKSAIKIKNSAEHNNKLESNKLGNISTANNSFASSYSGGSNNMRTSLSEIVMSEGVAARYSDKSLNNTSFCKHRCCTCKPLKRKENMEKLKKTKSKDKISSPYYNRNKDNYKQQDFNRKHLSQENLHLITNSKYFNESPPYILNSTKHNRKFESSISSQTTNDSLNCQHTKSYIYKCSLVAPKEIPPIICNCTCCRKFSSIPSKTSRNSFNSSQSCPQLDVIKEEDSEIEDLQTKLHDRTLEPNKPQPQIKMTNSESLKVQKTFENSCADFLNIICDNIMESVQKSVDIKLKEFDGHLFEKFEILCQKLDDKEQAVKDYSCHMVEEMTKQNESNFEKLYKLIENLSETITAANQLPQSKNTYQDQESQYDKQPIMKQENVIIEENQFDGNSNENETNNLQVKMKGCDCCRCFVEGYSTTHPLAVNKSLSEKTLIVGKMLDDDNVKSNTHRNEIQIGSKLENARGGREVKELETSMKVVATDVTILRSEVLKENMIIRKFPTSTVDSKQTNHFKAEHSKVENLPTKEQFPIVHNLIEEILNKNSFPKREINKQEIKVNSEQNITTTLDNINENLNQITNNFRNFPNFYDNYDTSGYATEPEDNNEQQSNNSGRKKLQKKANKQNHNFPNREHPTNTNQLATVNAVKSPEKPNRKQDDSDHSVGDKVQSAKSSRTRLSRL